MEEEAQEVQKKEENRDRELIKLLVQQEETHIQGKELEFLIIALYNI